MHPHGQGRIRLPRECLAQGFDRLRKLALVQVHIGFQQKAEGAFRVALLHLAGQRQGLAELAFNQHQVLHRTGHLAGSRVDLPGSLQAGPPRRQVASPQLGGTQAKVSLRRRGRQGHDLGEGRRGLACVAHFKQHPSEGIFKFRRARHRGHRLLGCRAGSRQFTARQQIVHQQQARLQISWLGLHGLFQRALDLLGRRVAGHPHLGQLQQCGVVARHITQVRFQPGGGRVPLSFRRIDLGKTDHAGVVLAVDFKRSLETAPRFGSLALLQQDAPPQRM